LFLDSNSKFLTLKETGSSELRLNFHPSILSIFKLTISIFWLFDKSGIFFALIINLTFPVSENSEFLSSFKLHILLSPTFSVVGLFPLNFISAILILISLSFKSLLILSEIKDNYKLKYSYNTFISLREGSNIYEKNINEFM